MRRAIVIVAAFAAFVLAAGVAQAAPLVHETYGECTYACDAARRICLQEQGKLSGGIERCDAERSLCRERCEPLRDKEKPVKPKQQ